VPIMLVRRTALWYLLGCDREIVVDGIDRSRCAGTARLDWDGGRSSVR
jgi:hypothetical protein